MREKAAYGKERNPAGCERGTVGKRACPAHLPWDAVTTVMVTFRGQLATT